MNPVLLKTICSALFLSLLNVQAAKKVAYIYGDIAEDGTMPSGTAPPYDQMLLTDSGNTGCSQFKTLIESQGYTISQHYDQTTTLNAPFLAPFDVLIFGLHQKIWTPAEKAALDTWIRSGGGILMYSDSAAGGKYNVVGIKNPTGQNAVNNILTAYGMQVTVDQGGGIRAYTAAPNSSHPIIRDQPAFEGEGVSPVAIDLLSGAEALILLDDAYKISGSSMNPGTSGITIANPVWAVVGHQSVGDGNVIATFDRQPMWNNGTGSDINEEDNQEILRRIVRFLARDYGNSSEWINFQANGQELSWRQWTAGQNMPVEVQHNTNLVDGSWFTNQDWINIVATAPESSETEITIAQWLPTAPTAFARVAILPATKLPTASVLAINCGGSAYTGSDGISYLADRYFVGGHIDAFAGNAVANTDDDLLYNYARSDFSAYNIPLANGNYTVRLKFAETYWVAVNKRAFDISLEGTLAINDLDLFATAPGKWVAYDLEFPVTVSDGTLSITASASINNALLNAIVVIPE